VLAGSKLLAMFELVVAIPGMSPAQDEVHSLKVQLLMLLSMLQQLEMSLPLLLLR